MLVSIEKEFDKVILLSLKGKLITTEETEKLKSLIQTALDRKFYNVIFNLKNLSRISSLGIGAIMQAMTIVRNAGGDLRLAGLDENIKNIFSITKLIGVIRIFDQNDQAIDSFSK